MFAQLSAWLRKGGHRGVRAPRRVSPRVEALEERSVPAIYSYHGGPLLGHVEVQAVFYGARWSDAAHAGEVGYLEGFLNTIVHDSYLGALAAGYGVGPGSASPGKRLPIEADPRSQQQVRASQTLASLGRHDAVTDGQIRQALQGAIRTGRLRAPDRNRLYVIYVQPHTLTLLPFDFIAPGHFCVYQATFRGRDARGRSVPINYAVVPYPGPHSNFMLFTGGFLDPSPLPGLDGYLPGLSTLDALTALTSRALVNAITDPGEKPGTVGHGWNNGTSRDGFGYNFADNSYDSAAEIGDFLQASYVRLDGYTVLRVPDPNGQPLTPAGAVVLPPGAFAGAAPAGTTG